MRDRQCHKAAVACLRKALELSDSAETLKAAGNTSQAISLMVLACEEIANGINYSSIADGLLTTDIQQLGKTWVFDKKILFTHELKQLMAGSTAIVPSFLEMAQRHDAEIEKLGEDFDFLNFTGELPDEIRKRMEAILDSDQEYQEERKKLDRLRDLIFRMEEIKERGFYAGSKDGSVVAAASSEESDYKLLRDHFYFLISRYSDGICGLLPPGKAEFHRAFMKHMVKKQKRPTFQGFDKRKFRRSTRRLLEKSNAK